MPEPLMIDLDVDWPSGPGPGSAMHGTTLSSDRNTSTPNPIDLDAIEQACNALDERQLHRKEWIAVCDTATVLALVAAVRAALGADRAFYGPASPIGHLAFDRLDGAMEHQRAALVPFKKEALK